MPDWVQLLSGGCAFGDAPFGVHPADEERAKRYRKEVRAHHVTQADVRGHVLQYALKRNWHPDTTTEQLARVMKFVF